MDSGSGKKLIPGLGSRGQKAPDPGSGFASLGLSIRLCMLVCLGLCYPHHVDADPNTDPAFHFVADPDPTFHFDADPDPASQNDTEPCMRIRIRSTGLGYRLVCIRPIAHLPLGVRMLFD